MVTGRVVLVRVCGGGDGGVGGNGQRVSSCWLVDIISVEAVCFNWM